MSRTLIMPPWHPLLGEPAEGLDLTWAYEWPAGQRMASELPQLVRLSGSRVAELGCGRGRCGLTALLAGAAHVTFADGAPEPLTAVQLALTANGVAEQGRTVLHRWGEAIPGGPFAVLLGADILYRPALHSDLLRSIAASLTCDGVTLLADPREHLEAELPELAHHCGLTLHQERRAAGYTLCRLTLKKCSETGEN